MSEVWLILLLVAWSCGLMGSILVLRDESMLADALSHSVLLGIVLGFFISQSLESPLLIGGAAGFGVLSVLAIDFLHTRKIAHDAATGLVFSFFFALGVILISMFARNVHLDVDIVLMGEVLFAPLNRVDIMGLSLPVALVKAGVTLVVNVLFFLVYYQPLKLYLFDATQARLAGVKTKRWQLLILLLVSFTTVLSFDAIGSMTVIVFLVAPAMTVLAWAPSFSKLLLWTQIVGFLTVTVGYMIAYTLDLTMSGTCAVVSLVGFIISVCAKKYWHK